ncbi:GTPase activating protein 1-like [Nymphaea colorata]|nr:GTPase activating protein 1-like [Nymphaea colorata]
MEHVLGLMKVHVIRGTNLAVRDTRSSDPYVVVKMGDQRLKTHVKQNDLNPEWDEKLTLSVSEPILPVIIEVFDKDTFTKDDKMGDAEVDLSPFMEAVEMHTSGTLDDTVYKFVLPTPENCLAKESCIKCVQGKVVQYLILRLRNVECGEIEMQLSWVPLGCSK